MQRFPSRRRPLFAILAFWVLLCGSACERAAEPADAPEAGPAAEIAAVVSGKLNAEAFRQQIEALEKALYLDRPETADDYRAVGRAVLELVNAIGRIEGTHFGRSASGKLLFFSARAETGSEDPLIRDLTPIRKEWEKLRSQYFSRADWFRRAGTRSSRSSSSHPQARPEDLASVEAAVTRLERLVLRGRLEVVALGEPKYTLERIGAEGKTQINGWMEWTARWAQDVREATTDLPQYPGPKGPGDLVEVLEHVDMAVLYLERISLGEGSWATPFARQWEDRFARAEKSLRAARSVLSRES
ncbi:MAG: hypothetical protein GY725_14790 [bacterium]|nr:hypothetical protein [bacterium]